MNVKSELQTLVRNGVADDYVPPFLHHADDLLSELKAAAEYATSAGEWAGLAAAISHALQEGRTDQFLRLPPVAQTMHPSMRLAGQQYLDYLLRSTKFSLMFQSALTETPVGKPLLHPSYPLSSPLLLQHGYHLIRLIESTGLELSKIRLVVEFGGGYGSFYRLLRNLGYTHRYIICDLPVMCALQRFYLRNLFPREPDSEAPQNIVWLSGNDYRIALERETTENSPSLFVATWSLSETPLAVRTTVTPALEGFTYILCAYQASFGNCDNVKYFARLQKRLPQFAWDHHQCSIFPDNFYMIGRHCY